MNKSNIQIEPNKLMKLSASSTKTYEQCAKKYYYSYIEKLPKKEWGHLTLGTFCHAVLEQFHEEWLQDKNVNLTSLIGKCFSEQRKNYKMTPEQLEDAKTMLQEYLFSVEKNGMPNVLSNEEAFEIVIENYLIRGFIDRIDIDKDGTFHILDYKTSKSDKYMDDFQLLVYGLALKNKYPDINKLRGSYIFLRQNSRLLTYEFDLSDLAKCQNKIIEYGKSIESETKWETSPGPLCKWCDFYEPCQGGLEKDAWIK